MPNTHITKNYFAHGGDELVIGGRLTVLPDAVVDGLPGEKMIAHQEQSAATTVTALKDDFNGLPVKLQEAGLMAEAPEETDNGEE